jgi:hypothetical protein
MPSMRRKKFSENQAASGAVSGRLHAGS